MTYSIIEADALIIALSVVLFTYYLLWLVFIPVRKLGELYDSPNRMVTRFRTQHKIKTRSFKRIGSLRGFTGLSTIYINENLFKSKRALTFVLNHELYHYKHHHTLKIIILRLLLAISVLLLMFIDWRVFSAYFSLALYALHHLREVYFEKKANSFAKTITDEQYPEKKRNNN